MFHISKRLESWSKERLHMKGIRTPRFFVMFLGGLHRRKGVLRYQNGSLFSPFLEKKQKDFSVYCSEMYKLTAKLLQDKHIKESALLGQLKTVTAKLDVLMADFPEQKAETVHEKRRKAQFCRRIEACKTELNQLMQELKETQLAIAESELETQEMILAQKSRAEALLVVYLDGGGYSLESRVFELGGNIPAMELYQQYTGQREQIDCIEEREVEAYVIKDI